MKTYARTVCALSIGMSMAGCSTAPHTPEPDAVAAKDYPNIVLFSGLENYLVSNPPTVTPPDKLRPMEVVAPVRSISDATIGVQYRFLFFDRSGKQITTNPVWHEAVFHARERIMFSANSISQDAVNWNLELRRQR